MDNIIILAFVLMFCLSGVLLARDIPKPESFWKDGVAIQTTARTPQPGEKFINAKVDGKWNHYSLVDFPPAFWEWNKERRKEYLDIFREMLAQGPNATRQPELAGPHNGIIATYGARRKDSLFKLNNAIKGMGFLPKEELLPQIIQRLESSLEEPLSVKLDILDSLYANAETIFSSDRLASLELYAEPGYLTQTFINQMVNPSCVIVWMDIPTYKIKSIVRLLDPKDSSLSDYEKLSIRYINLMHSYFHGQFPKDYIAAIYYNVEVYDSSPGRKDARGTKLTP
ncbi:MAG TPA: hypothetical protein PKI15_09610 [Candidatus Cloacimonadota bacterium]|nr:hypothetical protein [Candidatus Cloacimonadota bacterium]